MNTSRLTVIIAQGIALWAAVQDQPISFLDTDEHKAWKDWTDEHNEYVEFVKREQFSLFDRVNGAF